MDSNEGEKGKLARLILAFFILLALFILVSEFASAAGGLTDATGYYSWIYGNFSDFAGGNWVGTNAGSTNTSGVLDSARAFDGTAQGVNIPCETLNATDSYGSVAFWFNYDTWTDYDRMLGHNYPSNDRLFIGLKHNVGAATPELWYRWGTLADTYGDTELTASQWYYVVLTLNNTKVQLYIDGVTDDTEQTTSGWVACPTAQDFCVGRDGAGTGVGCFGTNDFDGVVDEVAIYPFPLTAEQVSELYNGGLGFNPYATIITEFSVSASDIGGNPITNFSATINGTEYATTDGGMETNITPDSGIINITVYSAYNNNGAYFNATFISINTAVNYEASGLYQAEIKSFTAIQKYTNTTLTGAFYNDTAEQNPPIFLLATSINFTFFNVSHYNKTQEFNIIALQNDTKNITGVYNTILNTTASNPYGGAITDFNVSIYQGILGINETQTTSTGEILFNVLYDYNYTVTFTSPGLTSNTTYVYIANETNYTNFNFITFAFNSINLNIFNGTTKDNLLTQLITISIFSNVTNEINTTTTGTLFRSFLMPVTYELRFNSTGFNPTSKFITVINDSNQNISIFMLSNVSHELQIIEVVDTANQPIEGVIVWLQREVPGGGAGITYVTTQEAQTDFEGKTAVWIIKDTAIFYRFSVIKNGTALGIEPSGNTVTGKTFFIPGVTETVQLIVNLETAAAVNILEHQNIITDMTFSPPSNNNTVTFTWIDGANIISGATLKIEARYLDNVSSTFEFITQVSSDLTSGLLNFTLIPLNNTIYRLTGLLNFTGYAEVFEQKERVYTGGLKTERNLGLLYAAIVLITMALITVNFGALVSSLFTFGALIPLAMFSIISVPVTIITSLLALAFVLFIKIRKDEGG